MLCRFREFALRRSVLEMAVGVALGGAFGRIIGSLVEDILMPPLGLLLGRVDLGNLFLSSIVDFVIIAATVYVLMERVDRLSASLQARPTSTAKKCPYCLSVIPRADTRCAHCTSELG